MKNMWKSAAILAALASVSTAQATVIRLDGPEKNLQNITNDLVVTGPSSVNVVTDQYALDEVFAVNSVAGGYSSIIVELAGYATSNRFGIYDIADPTRRAQIFAGADGAGAVAQFSIDGSGQVYRNGSLTEYTFTSQLFGFYLDTPAGLWYSQSALNADRADHLVAYQGENELINTVKAGQQTWGPDSLLFGWEDLSSRNWDQDYNDFVVLVSGVKGTTVPEPGTLALLGLGLAGIGVFGRRRAVK